MYGRPVRVIYYYHRASTGRLFFIIFFLLMPFRETNDVHRVFKQWQSIRASNIIEWIPWTPDPTRTVVIPSEDLSHKRIFLSGQYQRSFDTCPPAPPSGGMTNIFSRWYNNSVKKKKYNINTCKFLFYSAAITFEMQKHQNAKPFSEIPVWRTQVYFFFIYC